MFGKLYISSFVFVIFFFQSAYGQKGHEPIIPIVIADMEDSIIKKDVLGIINNAHTMIEYKAMKTMKPRENSNNIYVKKGYRKIDYSFYVHMKYENMLSGQDESCKGLQFHEIAFHHVKYMSLIDSLHLKNINEMLFSKECGYSNFKVNAYYSHEHRRNYLYVQFEGLKDSISFIFIVYRDDFYKCVVINNGK